MLKRTEKFPQSTKASPPMQSRRHHSDGHLKTRDFLDHALKRESHGESGVDRTPPTICTKGFFATPRSSTTSLNPHSERSISPLLSVHHNSRQIIQTQPQIR